jgi:hypothetical protein
METPSERVAESSMHGVQTLRIAENAEDMQEPSYSVVVMLALENRSKNIWPKLSASNETKPDYGRSPRDRRTRVFALRPADENFVSDSHFSTAYLIKN